MVAVMWQCIVFVELLIGLNKSECRCPAYAVKAGKYEAILELVVNDAALMSNSLDRGTVIIQQHHT